MKWLKILHTKAMEDVQNHAKNVQDSDTCYKPVAKDIGEPVFSFVNCVKENNKRFTFEHIGTVTSFRKIYVVTDKQTGEKWRVSTDSRTKRKLVSEQLDWLTAEETNYIDTEIYEFFNKRKQRLNEIKKNRIKRIQQCERKRLIGVYCK